MTFRILSIIAAWLFLLFPSHAKAERVWDSELKRFLTEQEMAMAEVYLTEEEALKLMFPQSQKIRTEFIRLSPEKKIQIEERIGWKFPEDGFEIHIGETGTQIDGYAVG